MSSLKKHWRLVVLPISLQVYMCSLTTLVAVSLLPLVYSLMLQFCVVEQKVLLEFACVVSSAAAGKLSAKRCEKFDASNAPDVFKCLFIFV